MQIIGLPGHVVRNAQAAADAGAQLVGSARPGGRGPARRQPDVGHAQTRVTLRAAGHRVGDSTFGRTFVFAHRYNTYRRHDALGQVPPPAYLESRAEGGSGRSRMC